jgi:hypothetical protein
MMNFCPKCGTRCEPQWHFCGHCGTAIAAEGERLSGFRKSPAAGLAVFCALTFVGVGMWIQILEPKSRTGPPGSPVTTSLMTRDKGAAGVGAVLPEGHPPIDRLALPEDVRTFIDNLAAEAEKRPRDATAWERLSEIQERAARVDGSYYLDAIESYRHLLELAPENTKALRGLAGIYYDLGKYGSARPYLEKYLTLQPNDPGARTDLATVRLRLGDVEQAIADYRGIIETNPGFIQAYLNLGVALHETGNDREALEALRRAREVATDEPMRARVERLIAQLEERSGAMGGP